MSKPNLVFLLVIHMVKRDITYMISKLIKSMFLVMSYFMSQFYHIMIFHLHLFKNPITITPINNDGTFNYTTLPIVPTDDSSSDHIPHNLVDCSNDSPVTIPISS